MRHCAAERRSPPAARGVKVRFFGGWHFGKRMFQKKDWIRTGYVEGVPMGGDLPARSATRTAPSFAAWAIKDPNSGNLDRLQVIKVWEQDGKQKEKIFDVVWSSTRVRDTQGGQTSGNPPIQ